MPTSATSRQIETVFAAYAAAWAAHDVDRIAALHTADTTFWLRTGGDAVHGRDEVRRAFAALFVQFPDFGCDVHRVLYGADHWVLDWALTCTLTDADGTLRPARWDCLDVVTITRDGLVAGKDTFIDAGQAARALRPPSP